MWEGAATAGFLTGSTFLEGIAFTDLGAGFEEAVFLGMFFFTGIAVDLVCFTGGFLAGVCFPSPFFAGDAIFLTGAFLGEGFAAFTCNGFFVVLEACFDGAFVTGFADLTAFPPVWRAGFFTAFFVAIRFYRFFSTLTVSLLSLTSISWPPSIAVVNSSLSARISAQI